MHPWSATIIINEDSRSPNEKHMTNGIAVSTFPCNLEIDTSSLPWTPLVLPLHHQFSTCQRYVQRFCPQIHVWCFESGRSALREALSLSAWNKNPWLPNGPQAERESFHWTRSEIVKVQWSMKIGFKSLRLPVQAFWKSNPRKTKKTKM